MEEAVTLSQISDYLRRIVSDADVSAWIIAEVHSISYSRHCYLECIEKSEVTGEILARLKMNIWSNVARRILSDFEAATGQPLAAGMKVLVYATIQYHEVYGMSGTITAINPEFTLGDIEKQRRETIRRLTEDGVIDMNKHLDLPSAIQHIAVVSSESAAGYGDFCDQLRNNVYGLGFSVRLYPSLMQGNEAPQSIIEALDVIASQPLAPDIVVIIRGGGSRADLLCFDDYELASNIAQFPLPILTGIGHDRDESVADIVANTHVKTPTAAAEFLISHNYSLLCQVEDFKAQLSQVITSHLDSRIERVDNLRLRLVNCTKGRVQACLQLADRLQTQLRLAVSNKIQARNLKLSQIRFHLRQASERRLRNEQHRIDNLANIVRLYDPVDTLRRGFTITTSNGRRIKSATQLRKGDVIETITSDGKVKSVVD